MYLIFVHIPALSYRVCIEKPQIENCSQFSTDAGKEMLCLAEIFISKKRVKLNIYSMLARSAGFSIESTFMYLSYVENGMDILRK